MFVFPKHWGKMGLFEISENRELTLERLQLSSINPFLTMPTLKSILNEVHVWVTIWIFP